MPERFSTSKAEWSAHRNFTPVSLSWSHQVTGPVRINTAAHLYFYQINCRIAQRPRVGPVRSLFNSLQGVPYRTVYVQGRAGQSKFTHLMFLVWISGWLICLVHHWSRLPGIWIPFVVYLIIIKSAIWNISNFSGLGHNIMLRAVCFTMHDLMVFSAWYVAPSNANCIPGARTGPVQDPHRMRMATRELTNERMQIL